MALQDPKAPLRSELAKVFKDQRTLKAFEKIFELIPSQLNINEELLEAALIAAESADANSVSAIALVAMANALAEYAALQNDSPVEWVSNEDIHNISEPSRKIPVDYLEFDTTNLFVNKLGRLAWNPTDDTLNIGHSDGVVQQVGEETFVRITNSTGTTILNGEFIGLTGTGTTTGRYIANGTLPPIYAVGVATQNILNGQRGRLTVWGRVRDLNTSSWPVGSTLYVSPTVAGALTNVKPTAPNLVIPVGVVTFSHATDGEIFVRPVIEQQLYYGAFSNTVDATLMAANTATAITFNNTEVSNGISLGSPASRVVAAHAGLYSFNVSFQLTSTSSSVKNVRLWFRKNGVDVPNSTLMKSLESNAAIATQTRSYFFSLNAGDFIELYWAADDTNVTLDAIPATAYSPAAPSCVLAVEQIQQ